MGNSATVLEQAPLRQDYSLTGVNSELAIQKGLAEADWYQCAVPRETMRQLLVRRDGPAIRDTVIWFALIIGAGLATWKLWGSWWALLPYAIYCVLYASTSDSRWHESSHGTAFKTDWMNNALYEIASFMVMRESTVWRWSHNRHHSDTIIVGRDPEIAVPRPPDLKAIVLTFLGVRAYPNYFPAVLRHCLGRMSAAEKTFIPETEFPKVYPRARIYFLIYASAIGIAIYERSIFPVMLVGLASLFGYWLMPIYGMTQHAGLAENVLDHRLNCRTVYMNPINRFFYWNMNYHVEHHMFPLVPYHALPRLHAVVKEDCPRPTPVSPPRGARLFLPCSGKRKIRPTMSSDSCHRPGGTCARHSSCRRPRRMPRAGSTFARQQALGRAMHCASTMARSPTRFIAMKPAAYSRPTDSARTVIRISQTAL